MRVRRPRPHGGGIGLFSIRKVPPVLAVSSPVMSSDIIASTAWTQARSAAIQASLARISSPHSSVRVRAGRGSAPSPIAFCRASAAASSVPQPLALSLAPGSWTCATSTTRWSGHLVPGNSATSVRTGRRWNSVSVATWTCTGPAASRSRSRRAARGVALKANDGWRERTGCCPTAGRRGSCPVACRRRSGRDHAGGPVVHRLGPHRAERAIGQDHGALHGAALVVARLGAGAHVQQRRGRAAGRCRERVDRQRHAVLGARQHHFAGRPVEAQHRVPHLPALARGRDGVVAGSDARRRERRGDRLERLIELRIAGQPPQRRHRRDDRPSRRRESTRGSTAR